MKGILKFLLESSIQNNVKHTIRSGNGTIKIADNYLHYYDEVIIYPKFTNNAFELVELYVNREDRNKGIAAKLLNTFIEFADSKNKDIVLYASPLDNDMTVNQLIDFYKKFGFEHDSRTKDKQCLIYKCKK